MPSDPSSRFYVVNLHSGGGRTANRWPRIHRALSDRNLIHDYAITREQGHGYDIAADAIARGYESIIAVGGDGTIYECANAIIDAGAGENVCLGTLPVGTGRDVARCLDILRPAAAMRAISEGHHRRIDAGRVEAIDARGRAVVRYFLLEASAGWIPEVAHGVPRRLKRLGDTAPYVITSIAKMARPMTRDFVVKIDDEFHDGRYNSISVHNMEYWGGVLRAAPGAAPDDGIFNVLRWGDLGRARSIKALRAQRNGGSHIAMDGIDQHFATSIRLASGKRTELDLDGEFAGYLPATISIVPGAIRFLAPPPLSLSH